MEKSVKDKKRKRLKKEDWVKVGQRNDEQHDNTCAFGGHWKSL